MLVTFSYMFYSNSLIAYVVIYHDPWSQFNKKFVLLKIYRYITWNQVSSFLSYTF
jgi:hypothetical protein